MYRLIVILILLGIFYWVVKRAFFPPQKNRAVGPQEDSEEMIQDPVCGCYIPKSQAFTLSYRGKKLYFCSQDCSHKYQSNTLPRN
jgi:YHS domain-containing protein